MILVKVKMEFRFWDFFIGRGNNQYSFDAISENRIKELT